MTRRRGEILREGFCLTVIGPPNSGKSSSDQCPGRTRRGHRLGSPGTTRDVLEVHLDLGGYPVIVADTAGLRETADTKEEGVRRALDRRDADAVLLLMDAAAPDNRFTGISTGAGAQGLEQGRYWCSPDRELGDFR